MEQERLQRMAAPALYKDAHDKLMHGSYTEASQAFDTLMSKYPFSRYATQAQLEQVYALYRSYKPGEAIGAATRFLQQHPRHPHADYILYIEGLVNTTRNESITRYFGVNQSEHDPTALRVAFQDFALLEARFPHSRYAADARQRMIALRNQIAEHELDITHFYMTRDAWVAAARRAQGIIENFPGAPQTAQALLIMKTCYAKLGLTKQVQQVDALIKANRPALAAAGIKINSNTAPLTASAGSATQAALDMPPPLARDARDAANTGSPSG